MDRGTTAALAVLSRALDRIGAAPASPARTAVIRDLAGELATLDRRAAAMRRAEILRLRREEELALAPLASRLGISKARAGQIIAAEQQRQEAGRG
jgi:hypothetical protein